MSEQERRDKKFFKARGGKRLLGCSESWYSRKVEGCLCGGRGCIESDWDAGWFYPCSECNPDWQRKPPAEAIASKGFERPIIYPGVF